jgi:hypothetical protein
MRASGLPEFFLHGIFPGEVGIAEKDAVFGEVGGSLGERLERGDAGVEDIEAAWAVAGERVNDIGEHSASSVHAEGSGARIFEEGRIVAVIDGGGDDDILRCGVQDALLEILGH